MFDKNENPNQQESPKDRVESPVLQSPEVTLKVKQLKSQPQKKVSAQNLVNQSGKIKISQINFNSSIRSQML